MQTVILALLTLASLLVPSKAAAQPSTQPRVQMQRVQAATSGTVPIDLRDNRIFVQLTCVRPDGSLRQARFQVDSGGGSVILSESLSHDLALKSIGSPLKEEGETFQPVTSPEIRIGEMPLNLSDVSTVVAVGLKSEFSPGSGAEGFVPARLLRKYEVVFDYPARQFTMAQPGALKPRGMPVPSPIAAKSGFPRIELTVDGEKYGFLLDTGAAYTMISQTLIDKWQATHPDWPRCVGAVGAANMIGGALDAKAEMLRLPEMHWGTFDLPRVGVVSRPPGTFEKWMSDMMTAPIVGSIAGNVLRAFRIEIDYRHGVTYLEKGKDVDPEGLNTVGVVIAAHPDANYTVGGVAQCGGKSLAEGVQPGDKLISINDWAVTGSLADVLHELQGKRGEVKNMVVERDGRQIIIKTTVATLW
jgi:PDZ domain/Aspartyl protease